MGTGSPRDERVACRRRGRWGLAEGRLRCWTCDGRGHDRRARVTTGSSDVSYAPVRGDAPLVLRVGTASLAGPPGCPPAASVRWPTPRLPVRAAARRVQGPDVPAGPAALPGRPAPGCQRRGVSDRGRQVRSGGSTPPRCSRHTSAPCRSRRSVAAGRGRGAPTLADDADGRERPSVRERPPSMPRAGVASPTDSVHGLGGASHPVGAAIGRRPAA